MSGCIPGNGVRRQNGIGNKFHCVSPVRRIVLLQPDLYVPREPGDFRSGYLTRRVLLLFFFFLLPSTHTVRQCNRTRVV